MNDFIILLPEIRLLIRLGFLVGGAAAASEDSGSSMLSREMRRWMKADFFMVVMVLWSALVAGEIGFVARDGQSLQSAGKIDIDRYYCAKYQQTSQRLAGCGS